MSLSSFLLCLIMGNIVMSSPLLAPVTVTSAVIVLSCVAAIELTTNSGVAYAQSSESTLTGTCEFDATNNACTFIL